MNIVMKDTKNTCTFGDLKPGDCFIKHEDATNTPIGSDMLMKMQAINDRGEITVNAVDLCCGFPYLIKDSETVIIKIDADVVIK